jgi:poly(3-hydroxybutyrate) depolymerase
LWQDPWILSASKIFASLLLLGAGLTSAGCSRATKQGELPPLQAPSWRTELELKGFGSATLALPLGATRARPIVVVLHGGRDRPEWQCGAFAGLLGGRAFILCPRGKEIEPGLYGLGSVDDSEAELRAGLQALKARFGAHVAPSPILLVGYAEGAEVAADLARQEPSFFARVALIKGGASTLSSSGAKVFAERGGKRVLFFCTDQRCEQDGAARALALTRSGAQAKAVLSEQGPYLDARLVDALRSEMAWLLEGDTRFAAARR